MGFELLVSYPHLWWITLWKGWWKTTGKVKSELCKCGEKSSIHKIDDVIHDDIHIVIHHATQAFMRISTVSTITTIY